MNFLLIDSSQAEWMQRARQSKKSDRSFSICNRFYIYHHYQINLLNWNIMRADRTAERKTERDRERLFNPRAKSLENWSINY